jgi:hypothetical protein
MQRTLRAARVGHERTVRFWLLKQDQRPEDPIGGHGCILSAELTPSEAVRRKFGSTAMAAGSREPAIFELHTRNRATGFGRRDGPKPGIAGHTRNAEDDPPARGHRMNYW